MMSAEEREKIHKRLFDKRKEALAARDKHERELRFYEESRPSERVEEGQEEANTEVLQELLDQASKELADIDEAIAKLGQGVYGQCEKCSAKIPEKRLEIVPGARFCVNCLDAMEQGRAS